MFWLATGPTIGSPLAQRMACVPRRRSEFAELLEPLGLVDKYCTAFEETGILFEVRVKTVVVHMVVHTYTAESVSSSYSTFVLA